MILGRVFRPKREEGKELWKKKKRKIKAELHKFSCLPNSAYLNEMTGHVKRLRKKGKAYKIIAGKGLFLK